jgi:hypothetical protein
MEDEHNFEFIKLDRLKDLPKSPVKLRAYAGVTVNDIIEAYRAWSQQYNLKIFVYTFNHLIFVRWIKNG